MAPLYEELRECEDLVLSAASISGDPDILDDVDSAAGARTVTQPQPNKAPTATTSGKCASTNASSTVLIDITDAAGHTTGTGAGTGGPTSPQHKQRPIWLTESTVATAGSGKGEDGDGQKGGRGGRKKKEATEGPPGQQSAHSAALNLLLVHERRSAKQRAQAPDAGGGGSLGSGGGGMHPGTSRLPSLFRIMHVLY